MNPDDLPAGLKVNDLEADLHCGPDLDEAAQKNAQAEDLAYEREIDLKLNRDL